MRIIILLFVFLVLYSNLAAQPSDTLGVVGLPPVLVTATQIPTVTTAVNRSFDIIKPSDAAAVPPLSLEEILRTSSINGIQSRGPFGVQTDVGIRGSSFSQNLILLNGMRLNDPQTAHHSFDLPVSVGDIDRVEIIKGSASTQYGADAFAGVINIITKPPLRPDALLRIEGGQYRAKLRLPAARRNAQ